MGVSGRQPASSADRADASKPGPHSRRRRNRRWRVDRSPMTRSRPSRRGGILVGAAIVISAVVVACTEDIPTNPQGKVPAATGGEISKASIVSIVKCVAKTAPAEIACDQPDIPNPKGPSEKPSILTGGQDQFVAVKSANANYDAGSGAFTFDVTVRNLMPQPLGT